MSLIQASVHIVDPENIRIEAIYLAQAYAAELNTGWAQSPAGARAKLKNIETQADALYRGLRDMGGLAGAYYTNLVDQEMAALARDMETILKIQARAGRIADSLPVKKGQETPEKAFLVRCWGVLNRLNCQDPKLPPKIGRAIHEAVTGIKEEKGSQQFDAPWKTLYSSL